MNWLSRIRRRLEFLSHRDRFDSDLAEEMRDHLEMLAQENEERGMTPDEARRAARRQLGNATWLQEESREMWGWGPLERFVRDVKYACRVLRKNSGATAVAVISLALAIGPNTFLFSLLNTMFLRPWAVENEHELVRVSISTAQGGQSVSYPDFLDYRDQNHVFSGLVAWGNGNGLLSQGDDREIVTGHGVSRDFFEVLGVPLTLGPGFGSGLESGGAELPIVLSYGLWQRQFGGDPGVVGRSVVFSDRGATVVGVAPRNFTGLHEVIPTDLWAPIDVLRSGNLSRRDQGGYSLVGRLRPGVTVEQAEVDMNAVTARLAEAYPENNQERRITLLQGASNRGRLGVMLSLSVLSLVGLVLLVACANVANLFLAQAEVRRRETAIRLAVGAGRGALVRQFLTQSLVVSLLAGACGLALGRLLVLVVPALKPPIPLPLNFDFDLDGRVLLYTLALTVATTVFFGLAPALRAGRADVTRALKDEAGQVHAGRWGFQPRNALVVSQLAVSVFLMAAGGLLLRSYWKTFQIPVGFDEQKNMLVLMCGSSSPIDFQAMVERIESMPGVVEASFSRYFPMSGSGVVRQEVVIPGLEMASDEPELMVRYNVVGLQYFSTMGMQILRGRGFERMDGSGSSKVTVINQTMAQQYLPEGSAVGRWIEIAGEPHQVVGIAENGTYDSLREAPQPFLYVPQAQGSRIGEAYLLVEAAVSPTSLAPAVRSELQTMAPDLIVAQALSLQEQMRIARYADEIGAGIVGITAFLAIFLSAVGLFGVVSYNISRRRREIGLRMAMGATRTRVTRMVLGYGFRLTVFGLPIGLAAALALSHVLASLLYGIRPTDPASFLGASCVVVLVAAAACFVPARRATRIAPMEALRHE